MTRLEMFNVCATKKNYQQTRGKVDWKIVNGFMFFRQSDGREDWVRNFLAAIPILVWLKGWQIVPLGAWLTYRQVRKIARQPVIGYVGYSQGGWPAVYAALENGRHATTFGCPAATLSPGRYGMVTGYKNPNDCVANVPPWALPAGNVIVLTGAAKRPSGMPSVEWLTGHTPKEYRQRLAE